MTTQEFSERFDTYLQSYSPAFYNKETQNVLMFDEYEKSVFLTRAQNEIVISLSRVFEQDEEIRRKLAVLVKTATFSSPTSTGGIVSGSLLFQLPSDVLRVVFEKLKINSTEACFNGTEIKVLPITHDEYFLQKDNPFRKPKLTGLTQNAWRLDNGQNTESLELILPPSSSLNTYTIRYIRDPKPIILTNLAGNSIEGISVKTECELDSYLLHEEILGRAVQLALSAISISAGQK